MASPRENEPNKSRRWFNLALAGIIGQVGCLTLLIILAATLAGLWLDNRFQTKPILTIVLLVVSIPISLLVMFAIVRAGLARIKLQSGGSDTDQKEEANIGKHE